MKTTDYNRIAQAINFLADNVPQQPSLEQVAAHVHMSPYHFQRMFSRWAGISPKRFLQVLTLEHSKSLLANNLSTLEVVNESGLSSGSRLYDHFVKLEAVTPGEYKSQGLQLNIEYGIHDSPFGQMFLATTARGICRVGFIDRDNNQEEELQALERAWPLAVLIENQSNTKPIARSLFPQQNGVRQPISLHVCGTNFQVAVWKALLTIPSGRLQSYSQLASRIGKSGSSRAVGTAIGKNPVGFFIPCHRVIQQSGALGGYRWGTERKRVMQYWEMLANNAS